MNTSTHRRNWPAIVCAVTALASGCESAPPQNATATNRTQATSEPRPTLENLKIWNRSFHDINLQAGEPFTVPLRFSFVPSRDTWQRPGGSVEAATGSDSDIAAAGYAVSAYLTVGQAQRIDIGLCGQTISWDGQSQTLNAKTWRLQDGKVVVHLVADETSCRVVTEDGVTILTVAAAAKLDHPTLTVTAAGGSAKLTRLEVWGLRSPTPTPEEARLAAVAAGDNRVFYRSNSYTVFAKRVEDQVYGPPAASVPDSNTIVSPTRAIEGFELNLDRWRPHPMGRVIDHQTIWHPNPGISRFPMLKTDWPTVDAAYRVALDVLHRCSTDEFISDRNDLGKWQAGFFMGKTFGFGIWMRDSTHVALRAGNMIDHEVARRTLLHITKNGIDNGCDGVLMPIVGLWDYYLVTGDQSAIRESWGELKSAIAKIESQFDHDKGLVRAAHSTSNDAFPEPEAGGFSLGTEAYFMLAYRAMAELSPVMNEDPATVRQWHSRAEQLRTKIQQLYWKDSAGFFTTGPTGSEGYTRNYWESAGQEMAIWPRFNIASPAQRRSVLDRLPQVAMNEFGVDVFPYRPETNHFCGAGWVVWTAGMAAAANQEGRLDLLQQLIGQQVRNAVMNKTFYEVIDCSSGRAWRWPGQLWQAAGFLAYFYDGVLGMQYTPQGLTLHPAVPQSLANMQISAFPYRGATLDLKVKGWGTIGEVYLDGQRVDRIPPDLAGAHTVEMRMSPTAADTRRAFVPLRTGRIPVSTADLPGVSK